VSVINDARLDFACRDFLQRDGQRVEVQSVDGHERFRALAQQARPLGCQ
jgi:hypothetical protein